MYQLNSLLNLVNKWDIFSTQLNNSKFEKFSYLNTNMKIAKP